MLDANTRRDLQRDASARRLASYAREWAREQETFILALGTPLTALQIVDAEHVGVKQTARIRVVPVDRIPFPADLELAEAARRAHIINEASLATTIGHGVMIRADHWNDRELMVHQFVHVAQCERSGGLGLFVAEYLNDRNAFNDFGVGSLEEEARMVAREICARNALR